MASCLGMYIETNLIKYAKVSKERDLLKVEAFGVKFYDTIGEAIDQIVAETYSYKTPISINLSDEVYQYFYLFNLLSKTDLKKAVETEFESFCQDNGFNRNALETRNSMVQDVENREKIKTIYISCDKAEINRKLQETDGYTVSGIYPLPMCIANTVELKEKENVLIVNMEEKTTVTSIIDEKVYNIDRIDESVDTILYSIKDKENSYSKAYEICRNTTIYTAEGKDLMQEENLYLQDIMPTLYSIVEKLKDYIDHSVNRFDKIYITGTGAIINNIDLYFEEYFPNIKCEILRPYFVNDGVKINIKDYIEVNSAIALAMQELGMGLKNLNFKNPNIIDKLPAWLKLNPKGKKDSAKDSTNGSLKDKIQKMIKHDDNSDTDKKKLIDFSKVSFDLSGKFDRTERWLARTTIGILVFIIIYSGISVFLKKQIDSKISEVQEVINDTNNSQIAKINSDIQGLNNKTSEYKRMTDNLKGYTEIVEENLKSKNAIPLLLTRIMNVIPKGVTITSIQNTTDSHVVINAQSEDYDSLGYFKGSIIVDGILSPSTVVSTSGVRQGGIIKIVIEGDLP